jgi:hypothetical protein
MDLSLTPDDGSLFNDDEDFIFDDTPTEYVAMEPLNLNAETEEQISAIESGDSFGGDDLSDVSMMDDFSIEPETQVSQIHDEPLPPSAQIPEQKQETEKPVDLSTQLLMKIAEELSSIRNELSTLKQQLHENKHEAAEQLDEGGGFFDEVEDEKIALTGDELNNILNTADFIEDTGESGDFSKAEDESLDPAVSFTDFSEQFPETDETFFSRSDAIVDGLPEIDEDFDLPPMSLEISPDLDELSGDGLDSIMPSPEDISFLEENPAFPDLSEDNSFNPAFDSSFDFENEIIEEPNLLDELPEDSLLNSAFDSSFDFENEIIEEPNFSETLQETPLEEPALEDFPIELVDMEIPPDDETFGLPDSGNDFGDIEEIELSLDDSIDSEEELSKEFSPDDEFPDAADVSIDELIDISDETQITPVASWDNDIYDQIIPEGFVIESEDDPALEETMSKEEFLESMGDSFTEQVPAFDEDIPEAEELPEEIPFELEPVPEQAEAETLDLEEETSIPPDAGLREPEEKSQSPAPAVPPSEASQQKSAPKEGGTHSPVDISAIPSDIKFELRSVLSYMDQLLESLPEGKIEEFAKSEYFETYKKLFEDLGLA